MAVKNKKYEQFGNLLVDEVISKLNGSHKDFKRKKMYSKPSNNILVGNLYPKLKESENSFNNSSDINSITTKFLSDNFSDDISISASFSIFFRVVPTYEEQRLAFNKNKDSERVLPIWKRKDLKFDNIKLNKNSTEFSFDFDPIIDELNKDSEVLKKLFRVEKKDLKSEKDYMEVINKKNIGNFAPSFKVKLKLDYKTVNYNSKELFLMEISLINSNLLESKQTMYEFCIFNPSIEINLNKNHIVPFEYKYDYEGIDKYYENYCRSLNCNSKFDKKNNIITTTNYAKFNQIKRVPKNSLEDISISFNTLSSEKGLCELNKIYNKMNQHYNICNENCNNDKEYQNNLSKFYEMKERFKNNIDLLKENATIAKAFYLMNKTFEANSKEKKYDSWRLFQIVFIVSLLKDICLNENRDSCELLHVMTGGGKSEAYFGLIVFTAFYDRLMGKEFGVSGITKFPLRMLSIQQLQRIANIFIHAENIRKQENICGEEFSIAYFVGNSDSDFPRHNDKILKLIEKKKDNGEFEKGKIIDKCPLCGGDVYLDTIPDKRLVVHKCSKCNETFRLYFSDDEIYRTLPTFIIATVDKFSGIASNRRFKNLFGGKLDICEEHGFMPRNDFCDCKFGNRNFCKKRGESFECDFDTGPTLIIQDEMHLIKEGFGTIDSHFESLIEAMSEDFNGNKFKNIVMTATTRGADIQIKNLYHKKTNIFPPTLKDKDGNDFFFNIIEEDGSFLNQRLIIGLRTNSASSRLILYGLGYISEFIKNVEDNLETFAKCNDFTIDELKLILNKYKKYLTYHNKKEDVNVINYRLEDHMIGLKEAYNYKTIPLTGENDTNEIKEIIGLIHNFYEENNDDKLLVVNATSIVSHGVDIDDWNLMFFDGMPRNTAEYIQALSRVGRKDFGIVFVSFIKNRARDLSFFQHFDEYHDILDYKVEQVPLSRWTKLGMKQTFTSIFCASILNYLSNKLERPIYSTEHIIEVFNDSKNKQDLIDFIKNAYVVDSKMTGSDFFDDQIVDEVEIRLNQLMNYTGSETNFFPSALQDCDNKYFKRQFGMRGIQDSISLGLSSYDRNLVKKGR